MAWRTILALPAPSLEHSILPQLTRNPGTYALALQLDMNAACQIGALGTHTLNRGIYIYIGSAWGPGGLAARISRHLRGSDKRHWHIDYLRQITYPIAVWFAPNVRQECTWAQLLCDHPHASIPIPGFGASDCRCTSHLFYFVNLPTLKKVLPDSPEFITHQSEKQP
jgi:Uri superfamily endonuclease